MSSNQMLGLITLRGPTTVFHGFTGYLIFQTLLFLTLSILTCLSQGGFEVLKNEAQNLVKIQSTILLTKLLEI